MRPGITETQGSFQLVSFTHRLVFARASGVYLEEEGRRKKEEGERKKRYGRVRKRKEERMHP